MQMTLEKASKVDLIRAFGNLSVEQIVKDQYPSVGSLSRIHSPEKVEQVMAIMLADLSASFDGALTGEAIQEICAEINSGLLRNLSLEDVYYTCRTIKFSDQYGKLNLNKVLRSLQNQMDARTDFIAQKNLNEHLANKDSAAGRESYTQKENNRLKAKHRRAKEWYESRNK